MEEFPTHGKNCGTISVAVFEPLVIEEMCKDLF
jgi:hypothetical protein